MTLTTIKCLSCTADIDADSCHCDQCGKEVFLCSVCGKPGDQKFCVFDGNDLIPAKQKNSSAQVQQAFIPAVSNTYQQSAVNTSNTLSQAKLTLTNNRLGIVIEVQSDAILGRNTGPYANILQNYSAISGKHLLFKYDDDTGWSVQDIGSTNGTKYSTSNLQWDNVPKCAPNVPVVITDKAFILIANIEFVIATNYQSFKIATAENATQRI